MQEAVRLGAWEKALLLDHLQDGARLAGWLVELDRPLAPARVAAALATVRRAFPIYFARVEVADDGIGAIACAQPDTPIEKFLLHSAHGEGSGRGYLRHLANSPLHPLDDGLIRCHLVDGPVPMLGLQFSHISGDSVGNGRLRQALALAIAAPDRQPLALTPAVGCHDLSIGQIEAALTLDVRALPEIGRRRARRRPLRLLSDRVEPDDRYQLRVFRAVVPPRQFAGVVARARNLGVTPIAILAAAYVAGCLHVAEPWAERPDDFVGLSVPRDLRAMLGRPDQIGNLALPQGVPVFADDPVEVTRLAPLIFERIMRGGTNRIVYRHFVNELREAAVKPVRREAPEPRLTSRDGRLELDPFGAFGVTEVANRGEVEHLGEARIVASYFQTPALTRRFVDGQVHLTCVVRWHQAFDTRLRTLFEMFLHHLFDGEAVDWGLL
jgi:hypothetical protein